MKIKLKWLVENFDKGLYNFYTMKAPFSNFRMGPCIYFHVRTVKRLRELLRSGSYVHVFKDLEYVELLYATLTAWGMNSIRGGAKLQNFEPFKENLENSDISTLEYLEKHKLNDTEDIEKLQEPIKRIYDYLVEKNRVMKTNKAIVGVSKTIHHLLPHLLMPVDKQHTIDYLSNLEEYQIAKSNFKYDSFENYWECIKVSHQIAKRLVERDIRVPSEWTPRDPNLQIEDRPMDTSIPKMIDNALIGLSIEK
jgi:hypothetical protein